MILAFQSLIKKVCDGLLFKVFVERVMYGSIIYYELKKKALKEAVSHLQVFSKKSMSKKKYADNRMSAHTCRV